MVNIYCPISILGYGIHAFNFTRAMIKAGIDMRVRQNGTGNINCSVYTEDMVNHSQRFIEDFNAPTIVLNHCHDLARYRGSPLIGYTVFETSEIKPEYVREMAACDKIWVVSKWAKEILAKYSEIKQDNVAIVREGVDIDIYNDNPIVEDDFTSGVKKLIGDRFAIINVGKFEKRKGTQIILDMMDKKIKNGITPVCLLGSWDNPFTGERVETIAKKVTEIGFYPNKALITEYGLGIFDSLKGNHRIVIFPRVLSEPMLANLYRLSDLGVFPYAAEGWCLPLIECLACGTRAVATNYSGATEFLPDTDCILINDFTMEPANDEFWFHGDVGDWAVVGVEALYESVSKAIFEGSGVRNTCSEKLLDNWNWDNAAKVAITELRSYGCEI
jgi:glycosyltransferase involved in cell wall biosynthesis